LQRIAKKSPNEWNVRKDQIDMTTSKGRTRALPGIVAAGIFASMALNIFTITQLRTNNEPQARKSTEALSRLVLADRLKNATLLRYALLTDYLSTDGMTEQAELVRQIDRTSGEIDGVLSDFETLNDKINNHASFEALKSAEASFVDCSLRALSLSRDGKPEEARNLIRAELIPLRGALLEAADAEGALYMNNTDSAAGTFAPVRDRTLLHALVWPASIVTLAAIVFAFRKVPRANRTHRGGVERYREAIENTPSSICLWGPDGRIVQVNTSFCRMLGYSEQQLIGIPWRALTHNEDQETSSWISEQLRKYPEHCLEAEQRYIHRNRSIVWTRIKVSLVGGPDKISSYHVVQVDDATNRGHTGEKVC
jgi:PAS domain S-box-containing protein